MKNHSSSLSDSEPGAEQSGVYFILYKPAIYVEINLLNPESLIFSTKYFSLFVVVYRTVSQQKLT